MGVLDTIRNGFLNLILGDPTEPGYEARKERIERMEMLRRYRYGHQRKQLKVKANQADDNLTLNYIGLVIDRAVSLLFGKSVEFDLPGEPEDDAQVYVDRVWDLNKKNILLHKLAQNGATMGTCYVKIMVDDLKDPLNEERVPRFVAIDPLWVEIVTDSEDMDAVHQYVITFKTIGPDGKEQGRREVIERELGVIVDEEEGMLPTDTVMGWTISNYVRSEATGYRWELMFDPEFWEYEFPPLIHWQNLPSPDSVYGRSDIEDIIPLQDRINFIASNISKIIRYHAHPKTWIRGGSLGEKASWGPDELVQIAGDNAMMQNLEMQSELLPSSQFLMSLRQSLFDISRTVDITSLADKLGALTNFGLRVLYQDAIAKLGSKRELYGDALLELNRRVLVLAGVEDSSPGELIWPEALPSDRQEEALSVKTDLELGLVSKHTASRKRGYDWEEEQERIDTEAASEDNIGAALLRAFETGA